MPKVPKRVGPVGLALTAVDVWRRLTPKQRRQILNQARKYGPLVAAQTIRSARAASAAVRRRSR